eukprot:gene7233-9864_t
MPQTNNKRVTVINWLNVKERFEAAFEAVFSFSKKAHFDTLPLEYSVIDGAKTKWRTLLFIDAMVFLLQKNKIRFSSKRSFNQPAVLFNCLLEELKETDSVLYESVQHCRNSKFGGHDFSLNCIANFFVISPWNTLADFKLQMMSDPPLKSRVKYMKMAGLLYENLSVFMQSEFDMPYVLKLVACSAIETSTSHSAVFGFPFPTAPMDHATPNMADNIPRISRKMEREWFEQRSEDYSSLDELPRKFSKMSKTIDTFEDEDLDINLIDLIWDQIPIYDPIKLPVYSCPSIISNTNESLVTTSSEDSGSSDDDSLFNEVIGFDCFCETYLDLI